MRTHRCEVVVVGAGVVGLATARALERSGRDVVVLEQFAVGHERGSSHGSSRIFRFAYDDPEWVRLAQESLPLWRELEAESGAELLTLSGSIDTGRDPAPLCGALEDRGASFELLEPVDVERRFGFRLPGPAVYQAEGGVAWAERTLAALASRLKIEECEKALALTPGPKGVDVQTASGAVRARAAIVCAGAWARPLLATAGVELPVRVTRETVAYFELDPRPALPSLIDWAGTPDYPGVQVYALDAGDGRLKAALHHAGSEADPDELGTPDAAAVASVAGWAAGTFDLASPEPLTAETCLYTSTADESFVLERHGPIVVGSACSGHAFKFAPAIGARLATLATGALTS